MALIAHLSSTLTETSTIGGIGLFRNDIPEKPVPNYIGYQFELPDAAAEGWVVNWIEIP